MIMIMILLFCYFDDDIRILMMMMLLIDVFWLTIFHDDAVIFLIVCLSLTVQMLIDSLS